MKTEFAIFALLIVSSTITATLVLLRCGHSEIAPPTRIVVRPSSSSSSSFYSSSSFSASIPSFACGPRLRCYTVTNYDNRPPTQILGSVADWNSTHLSLPGGPAVPLLHCGKVGHWCQFEVLGTLVRFASDYLLTDARGIVIKEDDFSLCLDWPLIEKRIIFGIMEDRKLLGLPHYLAYGFGMYYIPAEMLDAFAEFYLDWLVSAKTRARCEQTDHCFAKLGQRPYQLSVPLAVHRPRPGDRIHKRARCGIKCFVPCYWVKYQRDIGDAMMGLSDECCAKPPSRIKCNPRRSTNATMLERYYECW